MESAKGSRYDKSAIVYDLICESEEPEKAWQYFFENADYIDSSDEKEVDAFFTAQQLQKYEKEYSNLIDGILNKLVMRHCEKKEFYSELWESIMHSNIVCEGKNEKIFAIAKIWSDTRIPYFQVKDGIKMSDEEFSEIIKNNKERLQEVTFILNCQYEQRTETSSLLLEILEKCKDNKEKAVVMAKIIELSERKILYSILNNR